MRGWGHTEGNWDGRQASKLEKIVAKVRQVEMLVSKCWLGKASP